jgi:GntR family transcriptional regulator, transcriptional repressor for pyruvate dehydrogenase complex
MNDHKPPKSRLVADIADRLRDLILAQAPGEHLGSLTDVAAQLGVGIVTVQQAARILEHEGLLAVKRGPGGGYYGARPDHAAIERAFATYLRVHNIGYREAFELTVLLDSDIVRAAASGLTTAQSQTIAALEVQLDGCTSADDRIQFEVNFRETLLGIVERPLLELLSRVAMQLYTAQSDPALFAQAVALDEWRQGRRRILDAILQQDEELANFEAHRFRRMVMGWTAS